MKEGRKGSNNRGLFVLLGFLCLVIVGLGVGIVVVNLNYGGKSSGEGDASTEEEVVDSYNEYVSYVDDYDSAEVKIRDLAVQDPVNADEVERLLSEYIDKYLEDGSEDRANSFVQLTVNVFDEIGRKRELLEIITSVDLSVLREFDRCRYYLIITNLAKELGDNEIVQEYTVLVEACNQQGKI